MFAIYIITFQVTISGHLVRMPDIRLPKRVFYSELASGKRTQGGPKKRYKDQTWEETATNRGFWRNAVHTGVAAFGVKRSETSRAKRRARHERQFQCERHPLLDSRFACDVCGRVRLIVVAVHRNR